MCRPDPVEQVDVRGLVDQVKERVAVQLIPVGATVVATERDAQGTTGEVIEVESRVILVVLPAPQDHAVFPRVHQREEPVRSPGVLRDVERVLRELSGSKKRSTWS